MVFLPVPLRNQLNEPTIDGNADENARANCVAASLASAVSYLVGRAVYGDELKDDAYGQAYTGATDPAVYASVLAGKFGITLTRYPASGTASGGQLVAWVIANLQAGRLSTGAIPSEWANVPPDPLNPVGGTHEVTFNGYDPVAQTLTAMNPWPEPPTNDAWEQTQPVSWWVARLVYGRIFVLDGGHPMSSVVPVWNQANGTLAYPAHDGLPAITLDHGQAWYAQQNRAGRYPLHAGTYDGNGDSIVAWNDGMQTRADKDGTPAWVIVLEDSGPAMAAALVAVDQESVLSQKAAALAAQVATLTTQVAALQAQVAAAGPAASEIAQIKAILGVAA